MAYGTFWGGLSWLMASDKCSLYTVAFSDIFSVSYGRLIDVSKVFFGGVIVNHTGAKLRWNTAVKCWWLLCRTLHTWLNCFVDPRKTYSAAGNCGMFGLDCEMCYTVEGLEITKVPFIPRIWFTGNSQWPTLTKIRQDLRNDIHPFVVLFYGVADPDLHGSALILEAVS